MTSGENTAIGSFPPPFHFEGVHCDARKHTHPEVRAYLQILALHHLLALPLSPFSFLSKPQLVSRVEIMQAEHTAWRLAQSTCLLNACQQTY